MPLIQIRDLVKSFNGQTILNGINLEVETGEVKVIMGASGCGKTTLLRCLNRLVQPTSGTIHVDGVDVGNPQTDIRKLRQRIGFVFQQFALYRHLNVMDNVTLGLIKLRGMTRLDASAVAMTQLDRLEMGKHHDKYPSELSGGQKQRVALARVLAMDPSVVVLDEPTSALDPVMSQEVGALIRQLNSEGVTHQLDYHLLAHLHDEWQIEVIEKHADTVAELAPSAIRAAGQSYSLNVRLDGDTSIGRNWAETH